MVQLFKNIFGDVSLLYKNFFHWNISKVLILVYGFLIGVMFQLPFAIITLATIYFGKIDLDVILEKIEFGIASSKTLNDALIYILFLLSEHIILYTSIFLQVSVFYITLLYSKILFNKLYLKYIKGKKIKYFKGCSFTKKEIFLWTIFVLFIPIIGLYFFLKKMFGENEKNVLKFIQISFWNMLYLCIPIMTFLIPFTILFLSVGNTEQINILLSDSAINYFTILSFTFFVIAIVLFIYISMRIYFSYVIFADDKKYPKNEKAIFYIKESIQLTKGWKKIGKLLSVIMVFSIILFPIYEIIHTHLEIKQGNILNYSDYRNASEEQRKKLLEDDQYDYRSLMLEYETIDNKTLNDTLRGYEIYIMLLNIFYFFVLYKVIEMSFVSFYKRELVKKNVSN